ncbi:extracellular solute-binding protein family 5 [Beutenbergia cavernae DSM 12333]|uniref:Extracellular solute-binding protein family 5 n=1 Tax=Beutenbergia cavernae (strain ATCC BAA-8 / DSM 12333 / CCUG 43141 / JCM 11478 / NBRC 16432 / NCIMB 13614 / HKI 0122) TaxID=471853 RepID=C5BV62_BEUC1|nr:ABC transporter substrate-binding protein [Beutenbergia cavernae]ACQ80449.1 extracellular solute-binding protein family 5 [Beutenbergia cavernae DSM 12333]
MRQGIKAGVVGAAGLALVLSGCASQRGGEDPTDGGTSAAEQTFTFAASSDPASLDPAFASDGETFRVARQMFEGLVGTVPGTADPAPLLAEEWEVSDDGLEYTFSLREGVTFHDDTPFNAEAVCFNFERWNNFEGIAQSESLSYYWGKVNGGFASSENAAMDGTGKYSSCEAPDELTAVITLSSPLPELVSALSLPAFSMQSPTALQEYGADDVTGSAEAPVLPTYATEHPTGTGPFVFTSWSPGEQVVLSANPDYWGEQGQITEVVFPIISDPTARRQALEAGEIDGYDLVGPADVEALAADGFQIVDRDAFNVLYLGMNQAIPELADIRVRQAIAHAVDKEALVAATLPEGTEVATNFVPPSVLGYNDEVTTYDYDPDLARDLLAQAGVSDLTINFTYPTDVSRPYMPTPEQVFERVAADLEEVGITVESTPLPWSPDYLDRIQGGADHGLHLLGWTGDYNDTYNFVGVFFGGPSSEWGFDNPELFDALSSARVAPTVEEQTALYEDVNAQIMEFLPGVPIAHPVPSLAFRPEVRDYPASPVQDEVYNVVSIEE